MMWDKVTEFILTIKRMICNPLRMILHFIWIIITCQEEKFIKKITQLAKEERQNQDKKMPDQFIQGVAQMVHLRSI